MTAAQFIKYLKIPRLKVPRILTEGKKRLSSRVEMIQPIKGVDSLIRNVRSRHEILGILTSNSQENVKKFLKIQSLDCFDFISTVPKLSGKAKNLKAIMRTHSLESNDLIFIGDEIRDIKASKKAKVPVVGVTWGFNSEQSLKAAEPDYIVPSPRELDSLLEKLNQST